MNLPGYHVSLDSDVRHQKTEQGGMPVLAAGQRHTRTVCLENHQRDNVTAAPHNSMSTCALASSEHCPRAAQHRPDVPTVSQSRQSRVLRGIQTPLKRTARYSPSVPLGKVQVFEVLRQSNDFVITNSSHLERGYVHWICTPGEKQYSFGKAKAGRLKH